MVLLMKKLLGIMVLCLLWCNAGFAQEIIKIPLNFIILEVNENNFQTITTDKDIIDDLNYANKIFSQSSISFYIKNIYKRPGNTKNLSNDISWFKRYAPNTSKKRRKWDTEIAKKNKRYLRLRNHRSKIYSLLLNRDIDELKKNNGLNVYYLPSMIPEDKTSCGFASGIFVNISGFNKSTWKSFAVIGHNVDCDAKRGLILAHELGHLFAMPHTAFEGGNLLSPGYTNKNNSNTKITENQTRLFRRTYKDVFN